MVGVVSKIFDKASDVLGFGGGEDEIPVITAEEKVPIETAAPVVQTGATTTEKRNKRLAASLLTRNWGQPLLSDRGLTGL